MGHNGVPGMLCNLPPIILLVVKGNIYSQLTYSTIYLNKMCDYHRADTLRFRFTSIYNKIHFLQVQYTFWNINFGY